MFTATSFGVLRATLGMTSPARGAMKHGYPLSTTRPPSTIGSSTRQQKTLRRWTCGFKMFLTSKPTKQPRSASKIWTVSLSEDIKGCQKSAWFHIIFTVKLQLWGIPAYPVSERTLGPLPTATKTSYNIIVL